IKLISIQDGPGWFVHLSYYAPHPPFVVPEPYDGMYDPAEVPRPVRASSPAEEGAVHPWLAHYMERQRGSALWIDHRATDN
ncbi:MAG: phosphonate monoester hydrolase, partial [Actinobacteria bacterium]|nr:phosphonate monoester hydrolase [Actinomycetota bacterium]NIS33939.1 phosphonate monoester hydrolase [Actinomycetota bacterium]NIT97164.1 phosphonate monoester hydrolase [Actinomycetota bacterium]NIU68746.1 phosphonate monoester hydrolase [Actinomycetota bacterium]NIW30595.1 phosphonate monoester hydrolase [Actinomycetota bacterium]